LTKNINIKVVFLILRNCFHFFFNPTVPFIYGNGDSIFDYLGLIIADEKSVKGLLSLIEEGDTDFSFS